MITKRGSLLQHFNNDKDIALIITTKYQFGFFRSDVANAASVDVFKKQYNDKDDLN